jgi:hypothetical protein
MGGFGSGRPRRSELLTTDKCWSLDVNWLRREGCLCPGWHSGLQWKNDRGEEASIELRTETDHLLLSYRIGPEDITESVELAWAPCRFGGVRPYFLCPSMACGRHVVKLYFRGCDFLCRHCHGLAYASQGEGELARAQRRANKIMLRAGGEFCTSVFPRKPKGQWWRTYKRRREQAFEADMLASRVFLARMARRIGTLIVDPELAKGLEPYRNLRQPVESAGAIPP